MKDFELRILTKEVTELARSIGMTIKDEIKKVSEKDIQEKGKSDFVTYVDKVAEETIVQKLRSLFPEAGYLTEEDTANEQKEYMWVVDPLDGTTNFIHNVPLYSISIALRHKNETISGVVYEPNLDECFFAWKGGGAFLNDKKIKVSASKTLSDSLIATGFPYDKDRKLSNYMDVLQQFLEESHGIRRLGSAAVDLAYVACGRYEAFYEYGLKAWDIAAGAYIVRQAGGNVTDFKGEANYKDGSSIVASNGAIHTKMLDILNKNMM